MLVAFCFWVRGFLKVYHCFTLRNDPVQNVMSVDFDLSLNFLNYFTKITKYSINLNSTFILSTIFAIMLTQLIIIAVKFISK